jgi:hypothetical protein
VWNAVSPPNLRPAAIEISVSDGGYSKLFLVAKETHTFELVRGSLPETSNGIYEALEQLSRSHRLPATIYETIQALPIKWETTAISAEQFSALHDSLLSAFARFIVDAKGRYPDVVANGSPLYVHTPAWDVEYKNFGYENFSADYVWDVPDDHGKYNPMVEWVHQLLKFEQDAAVSAKDPARAQ